MSKRPRKPAVTIDTLELRRAPGIPRGFDLPGLGPGITIVHGPNGSGKSTAARAIHSLFWPDRTDDQVELVASFRHDHSHWSVRRSGRHIEMKRDGVACSTLTFPQLDRATRDRYLLALHDLIRAEDTAFAGLIAQEMSGGYDIEAAAKATGFEKLVNPRSLGTELNAAMQAHQRLLADQADIAADRDRLTDLEAASAGVVAARVRGGELDRIRQWLDAKSLYEEAVATFDQFDPEMANSRAGDSDLIQTWRREEPRLRTERETFSQQRDRLLEQRLQVGRDDTTAVRRVILAATDRLTALRGSDQAMAERRRELAVARDVASLRRAEIGERLPESLQLDDALRLLGAYADALDQSTEADRIAAAEARLTGYVDRPNSVLDTYAPQNRLVGLMTWIQTPPPSEAPAVPRSIRLVALLAALIIIAEAALLGYYWNEYAYVLAVIGVVLGLAALMVKGPAPEVDQRLELAARYEQNGYPAPVAWEPDAVADEIAVAVDELGLARQAARNADFWRTFEPELKQRESLQLAAAEIVHTLEAEIGADLELDPTTLRRFAASLDECLKAAHDVDTLEARVAQCEEAWNADLRLFQESLTPIIPDAATVHDVVTASATLRDLNDRCSELERLDKHISDLETELRTGIDPALARLESDCNALIERYGGLSIEEIASLADQHQAWFDALTIVKQRGDQLQIARNRLGEVFNETEWDNERVERELAECRAIEHRATAMDQEIGSIKQRVRSAENSTHVAKSLLAIDEARTKLLDKRHEQMRNAIGALVLNEIRAETRDANLPQVAKRARDLFVTFTQGAYELRPVPGKEPKFAAKETGSGHEKTLDELSSGTRLQLLMAVRLAFMEHQEAEWQLPLIFDETLANADDDRADALIDATLEIVAGGRQVFYFTAQLDEVEKWRTRCASAGIEPVIIDLAVARDLEQRERPVSVMLAPLEKRAYPPPGASSRHEYRSVLGVPPFDIWGSGADAVHLWYFVEDLPVLHRLMAQHHISTWGQVRSYAPDGQAPFLGIDRATFAGFDACAEAIDALIAAMRVGVGRPLDADALLATGQIPPASELACLELLQKLGRDGRRFLDHLTSPGVPGIGRTRIQKLREFGEESGYIVDNEPLTADQIRAWLARHCAGAIEAERLTPATIDRLLADVAHAMTTEHRAISQQTSLLPSGE